MLTENCAWRMVTKSLVKIAVCAIVATMACGVSAQNTESRDSDVPTTASDVKPVQMGQKAPNARVFTPEGEPLQLEEVYTSAPTVLIFYRGGWCPYCNTHLGKLALVEDELTSAGYQVVAISPDAPEFLLKTRDKAQANYAVLSDQSADAIKAFGLAFQVADETVETYRTKYKIDLENWAGGQKHHLLPVPAAYVIKRDGTIVYAHWNADYKQRIDQDELLKAALDNRDQ